MSTKKELRQQLEQLRPGLKIRKKISNAELKRLITEAGGEIITKRSPTVPELRRLLKEKCPELRGIWKMRKPELERFLRMANEDGGNASEERVLPPVKVSIKKRALDKTKLLVQQRLEKYPDGFPTYAVVTSNKKSCHKLNTAHSQYQNLFHQLYKLCEVQGWGDPFSYARSREIHMAGILGHRIASSYAGADAFDEAGECEYKSTISTSIKATYNGISLQDTWELQEKYLREEKIGKYENHYHARYDGPQIMEIWRLKCVDIIDIILPKVKKQFSKKRSGNAKDPRIGVSICQKEIQKHGVKVY